jgi:DNA-binding MarR family transcriptional regulator
VSGIIRVDKGRDNPYTPIPRTTLEDASLSWAARGLLGYLLSKPNDWQVQVTDLIRQGNLKRDGVYSLLRELERGGYVTREQAPGTAGKFESTEYTVYETALPKGVARAAQPYTAEPYTANPELSKDSVLPKTEITKTPSKGRGAKNETELPADLALVEGLPEAWGDWLAHRRELRCPLTPHAATEQFKKLRASPDPVRLVRHSLGNGWRGLFEPKPDRPGITRLDLPARDFGNLDERYGNL